MILFTAFYLLLPAMLFFFVYSLVSVMPRWTKHGRSRGSSRQCPWRRRGSEGGLEEEGGFKEGEEEEKQEGQGHQHGLDMPHNTEE